MLACTCAMSDGSHRHQRVRSMTQMQRTPQASDNSPHLSSFFWGSIRGHWWGADTRVGAPHHCVIRVLSVWWQTTPCILSARIPMAHHNSRPPTGLALAVYFCFCFCIGCKLALSCGGDWIRSRCSCWCSHCIPTQVNNGTCSEPILQVSYSFQQAVL